MVVAPALEQWIIDTCEDLEIPLEKYGFHSLKKLKAVTKSQKAGENQKLKDLFNTLKQKKNSPLIEVSKAIDVLLST